MSPNTASFFACGSENYTIIPKEIVLLDAEIPKKALKAGKLFFIPGKTVPILWSRLAANERNNTEQLGLSFSLG